MFMNGIMKPAGADQGGGTRSRAKRLLRTLRAYRFFLGLVVLPTLIVAGYYYLVASDQYESSADFVVRRSGSSSKPSSGSAMVLGFNVGGSNLQSEALVVEEYLLSHDAVARLSKEDQLVERFSRPAIDWLSALWKDDAEPETLLKYYRKHVSVEQDPKTGITQLHVHAFTPDDAYVLAQKLLQMGEERVNQINERTTQDQVNAAEKQLQMAERDLRATQRQITLFRRTNGDIDPVGSSKAQIGLVSEMTANLAAARARLNALPAFVSKSSPQYQAVAAQVRALEAQVAAQDARLTGQGKNIATGLGGYEDLLVRQDFAGKRYAAAAASYEEARADALKQQLYLVRVVDPNMAVKSMFPERGRIVLTVFCSLAIAYAIGWLLMAGVKEHSM